MAVNKKKLNKFLKELDKIQEQEKDIDVCLYFRKGSLINYKFTFKDFTL